MEERKEYSREYYRRNRERLLAKRKEYYQENSEQIKEYNRERHRRNAEQEREKQRIWRKNNASKIKQYREEHKAEIAQYAKEYRAKTKAKYKEAHHAVSNAIKLGKLKKQVCEACGAKSAQAHHDDYNKPLEVRWFCRRCHLEWHKNHTPKYGKEKEWTKKKNLE